MLARESEMQEQKLEDDRLAKKEEREKKTRAMEKAHAVHKAELARDEFESRQLEAREKAEQETRLLQLRQEAELAHLQQLQNSLGLRASDISNILVARTHGTPAKLIQIGGDFPKPVLHINE